MNKDELIRDFKYHINGGLKGYDFCMYSCIAHLQEELDKLVRYQGRGASKALNGDVYLKLIQSTYEKMRGIQLEKLYGFEYLVDEFLKEMSHYENSDVGGKS